MPYKDPIKLKQYKHEWGLKNKIRLRPYKKQWAQNYRDNNREQCKLRMRKYRNKPGVKEKLNKNLRNYREKMVRLVQTYKVFKGCFLCGESHYASLDIHHINPVTKKFTFGNNCKKYQLMTMFKELLKCVIICSNCHRKLHAKNKEFSSVKNN